MKFSFCWRDIVLTSFHSLSQHAASWKSLIFTMSTIRFVEDDFHSHQRLQLQLNSFRGKANKLIYLFVLFPLFFAARLKNKSSDWPPKFVVHNKCVEWKTFIALEFDSFFFHVYCQKTKSNNTDLNKPDKKRNFMILQRATFQHKKSIKSIIHGLLLLLLWVREKMESCRFNAQVFLYFFVCTEISSRDITDYKSTCVIHPQVQPKK